MTETQEQLTHLYRAMSRLCGLPLVFCRRPGCRRSRRCNFAFGRAMRGFPNCLYGVRGDLEGFYGTLMETAFRMLIDDHPMQPSPDKDKRELEEAAIEVVKTAYAPGDPQRRAFNIFLKRYRTKPMTPEERRAFIDAAKRDEDAWTAMAKLKGWI
jgi:hypothetical protein